MNKRRVLIVEDSAPVRQFLQQIIGNDPRLEVVAAVDSAEKALKLIEPLAPDVVSMDIHLPGMDGIQATQQIMQCRPTPIVIVSGSAQVRSGQNPMYALRAGALAVVEKPVGVRHSDFEALAERLCTQLALMSQVSVIRQRFNGHHRRSAQTPRQTPATPVSSDRDALRCRFAALGLVASTGGPGALQTLLPALGTDFPLPVVLVQHIMASFHEGFVQWLKELSPLPVCTVSETKHMQPGHLYVAPADRHVTVTSRTVSPRSGEAVCGQIPSGNVLFRTMAESLGSKALGVLLTGMGEDGAAGLQAIHEANGFTIAEDQSTAVVYGMPAAAVRRQAVRESLPLHAIAQRLRNLAQPSAAAHMPVKETIG